MLGANDQYTCVIPPCALHLTVHCHSLRLRLFACKLIDLAMLAVQVPPARRTYVGEHHRPFAPRPVHATWAAEAVKLLNNVHSTACSHLSEMSRTVLTGVVALLRLLHKMPSPTCCSMVDAHNQVLRPDYGMICTCSPLGYTVQQNVIWNPTLTELASLAKNLQVCICIRRC